MRSRIMDRRRGPGRPAFTLVELLVVIIIIVLVSAVVLPTVVSALGSRESREAARLLSAAIAGARDRAIHDGAPAGIRLLPDATIGVSRLADGSIDPAAPLAFDRWLPIAPAPSYSEGRVTVRFGGIYGPAVTNPTGLSVRVPSLILESAPLDPTNGLPNPPTSWAWNLRVGDRIQIGSAGPWYTIAGPDWTGPAGGNPERFVNWGTAGAASPIGVEWLVLTNGRDDGPAIGGGASGPDGWIDSGWDGVDNNGDGQVDEAAEWELESWIGSLGAGVTSVPYTVRRRPAPTTAASITALPTHTVIDATAWGSTRQRSRLPVDRFAGTVDVLLQPDGTAIVQTVYGVPSSVSMDATWLHFWLADRADVVAPTLAAPKGEWGLVSIDGRTGRVGALESPDPATAFAQAMQGVGR